MASEPPAAGKPAPETPRRIVPCVGGIVLDDQGRLLLVQRGTEPAKGRWSVPGGRVEPGESDEVAVAREVLEETGLRVTVQRFVGQVERDGPGGSLYVISDYLCTVDARDIADGANPVAGDDAADVRWCTSEQVRQLPLSGGLLKALTSWGITI